MSKAIEDVIAERRRQIKSEGWTPEHDDAHANGEMAGAAAAYALYRSHVDPVDIRELNLIGRLWPWAAEWWKPKSARQDLVRAAALLIAEIERLDRS